MRASSRLWSSNLHFLKQRVRQRGCQTARPEDGFSIFSAPQRSLQHQEQLVHNLNSRVLKDLRVIKNREISNMLIIDNCVGSFGNQLSNGIPILPFEGDLNDIELLYLLKHIRWVTSQPNIIEANSAVFDLGNIRFCRDPNQYVDKLVHLASQHTPSDEEIPLT